MSEDPQRALLRAYERLSFDKAAPVQSLAALRDAGAAVLRHQIDWYQDRARLHRNISRATRLGAIALGIIAAVLLELRLLSDAGQARVLAAPPIGFLGLDRDAVPFLAMFFGSLAGALLLADRSFQITATFTRFRLAEFELRLREARYLSEFHSIAAEIGAPAEADFERLKSVGYATFQEMYAIVRDETSTWGEGTRTAFETLGTALAAQRAAQLPVAEKLADGARAAAGARQNGLLEVRIDAGAELAGLVLRVRDASGTEVRRLEDVGSPSRQSLLLAGGLYLAELAAPGPDGRVLASAGAQVVADTVARMDLAIER